MVLPTGSITLSNLQTEYGGANPVNFNEYYAGGAYVPLGATGIASSGAINLNSFRGKNIAPNYVTTGFYQETNVKYNIVYNYYGWLTGVGSINSTSVYSHSVPNFKYGDIPVFYNWLNCYWYTINGGSQTLYITVEGDLRTSGPDYFRVGTNVIARTSFTRTYSSPNTYLSYALSTNPFPSTGNRCRVSNYFTAYGEPTG